MAVSEATYRQVALEDGDDLWELDHGRLRKKPPMTTEHQGVARNLLAALLVRMDRDEFTIGETVKVRTSTGSFYIPDVTVVPREYVRRMRETPRTFEAFEGPLPLVVEVWSPSNLDYDVEKKLAEYRQRGDQEIWHIHPYERWLVAWRRQEDGTYTETRHTGGLLHLVALGGVTVDLESLFD